MGSTCVHMRMHRAEAKGANCGVTQTQGFTVHTLCALRGVLHCS